ncbi:hypothetical protein F8D07_26780, partial [Klebsiella pneumoniae]
LISESAWEEMTCLFAPSLANIRSRSCAEQNEGLAYTTRVNCAETTITLCADSICQGSIEMSVIQLN